MPTTTANVDPKYPVEVATDGSSLFWTAFDLTVDEAGAVYRCSLVSNCSDATAFATNQKGPFGIAVFGGNVYWANQGTRLKNALKFTERGWVRIHVDRRGGFASIAVADSGIGIAPALRARGFEEFFQLDAAGAEGAGLGLVISQRFATMLGGVISLESTIGKGSRFTLRIPVERERTTAKGRGMKPLSRRGRGT